MVAGAGCKLALSIATNLTVLCMLYGCMMGNYDGLYLPMMVLGYICSAPFFALTVRTSQKEGQKASLMKYVRVAFICYIGVLVLLLLWKQGVPAVNLSLFGEGGITINLYTIAFIVCFGIGYGAYYSTADMPIPMVADCADYETYRSGKYVPGIMGTIFSLVDKLVSSFATLLTTVFTVYLIPGLNGSLPSTGVDLTPIINSGYEGVKMSAIICVCLLPMASWVITMFAMTKYDLSGDKLREIQAVNAVRKEAISGGMSLEEAMNTWKTIDQVPARFVNHSTKKKTISFLGKITDKIYNLIWGRKDHSLVEPSSNAIEIPEQYSNKEEH